MWAGTKIVAIAALSLAVLLWPSWRTIGVFSVVFLASVLVARLPRGIVPRIPRALWVLLAVSAVIAIVAGGAPRVHVGHVGLGLGGLSHWALFMLLGIEVLGAAALIGWTTPLADLAPALGRLGAPLRKVRVPVDELVGTVGLAIRCLPLLLDEARILRAARAARRVAGERSLQARGDDAVEMLFTALSNAIRRARELAEAIEARGGTPTAARESHVLGRVDLVTGLVVTASVAAMGLLR